MDMDVRENQYSILISQEITELVSGFRLHEINTFQLCPQGGGRDIQIRSWFCVFLETISISVPVLESILSSSYLSILWM